MRGAAFGGRRSSALGGSRRRGVRGSARGDRGFFGSGVSGGGRLLPCVSVGVALASATSVVSGFASVGSLGGSDPWAAYAHGVDDDCSTLVQWLFKICTSFGMLLGFFL